MISDIFNVSESEPIIHVTARHLIKYPGLLMRPEHNEPNTETRERETETKNYETETSVVYSVACESIIASRTIEHVLITCRRYTGRLVRGMFTILRVGVSATQGIVNMPLTPCSGQVKGIVQEMKGIRLTGRFRGKFPSLGSRQIPVISLYFGCGTQCPHVSLGQPVGYLQCL